MSDTFYLKYRPQTLDELNLGNVRDELKRIVTSKNIPHAFLFSGPKGSGKTSAARILAKIINCQYPKAKGICCNKCSACTSITNGNSLDVIEIDAASNRGIDDIRALRDSIKLSPALFKKKIYIIDEAHMLTTEASNALLKTLEEPPSHVVFILCTTNPEKLIGTIKSRCVNLSFRKANPEELIESLKTIVKKEKLSVEKEVYDLIFEKSLGSFRDAAKLLEQLSYGKKKLTLENAKEMLSLQNQTEMSEYIRALEEKNAAKVINLIEKDIERGSMAWDLGERILGALREDLISIVSGNDKDNKINIKKDELIDLIELLIKALVYIPDSAIEQLPLEIAFIKWCGKDIPVPIEEEKDLEKEEEEEEDDLIKDSSENTEGEDKKIEIKSQVSLKDIVGNVTEVSEDNWKAILGKIKNTNASIEALLRATRPIGIDNDTLRVGVFYKFHKERLEEIKNRKIFEEAVESILGKHFKICCFLDEPLPKVVSEVIKSDGALTESGDEDIIKVAEEVFSSQA